jgi:hypothetical protein
VAKACREDRLQLHLGADLAMRVRPIVYAALFTAGVEALAIYSTQPATSKAVPPAPAVVAAAAPARFGVAIPPTLVSHATTDSPDAATVNASDRLNSPHPQNDQIVRRHRMVRKPKITHQQQAVRWQRGLFMTFATGNY